MLRRQFLASIAAVLLSIAPSSARQAAPSVSPFGLAQGALSEVERALASAIEEVDALAQEAYEKDGVGGLTVGVVSGPALVWTKSYGFADMEARRPASADTIYRIGSITKQFTALMLLQLVEQGTVRLTDPVEKYVPEINRVPKFGPGAPAITLVQLATMTSGLSREPGPNFGDHSVGPVSAWEQKVLEWLPKTTYAHEPGTRYLYSNIGYAVLGLALSRAAGRPFTEYVAERVIKPLGMTRTSFDVSPTTRPLVARGYTFSEDGKADWAEADAELNGRGYRVPNGALLSTVADLAKFAAFELGEGPWVIRKETQEDNYDRVYTATGALASGYGVGFQLTRRGSLVALGHGGSTAGFRASSLVDRQTKTGVIVLRNADTGRGRLNPTALALAALEKVSAARK